MVGIAKVLRAASKAAKEASKKSKSPKKKSTPNKLKATELSEAMKKKRENIIAKNLERDKAKAKAKKMKEKGRKLSAKDKRMKKRREEEGRDDDFGANVPFAKKDAEKKFGRKISREEWKAYQESRDFNRKQGGALHSEIFKTKDGYRNIVTGGRDLDGTAKGGFIDYRKGGMVTKTVNNLKNKK